MKRTRITSAVIALTAAAMLAMPPTADAEWETPSLPVSNAAVIMAAITPECEPEPEDVPEPDEDKKIEQALLARAHRIDRCRITHYCAERYAHICGNGDGLTAIGTKVTPYITCAVDPKIIPLGSTVMVDYGDGELHYYVAEDTGCMRGAHIDLCVERHSEAMRLGVKRATVYWCEEG